MDKKRLTSENGKPIADNQNIQTADVRGPAMLQDVWYLENWSFFLDLKIIVLTVVNMFKGEKNAY